MDAQEPRRDLYPKIEPFEIGMLALDGGHQMYWEQSGTPDGVPVVFLHGGPGAATNPSHRRFFDPQHYRIILFDQRGTGRSTPFAEVTNNTTQHLISDIDALRKHLRVEQWFVFGGSWGATLALAYGIVHAERCLGFVLRGIFLGRSREIDWFLHGVQNVFPEAWRAFVEFLPEAEHDDLFDSYHRRLMDPDPKYHIPAAEAWNRYETNCSTLLGNPAASSHGGGQGTLAMARIEAHYFRNGFFMDDNHLPDNIDKLAGIPSVIVQGRYDMICPIATADELVRLWPNVEYVVVPNAGHSAMEPGIRSALVAATESFKFPNLK